MGKLRKYACLLAAFLPSLALLQAADVATTPVGVIKVTVAAGTGTGRARTGVSVPFDQPFSAEGQMVGQISSLTTNTISNAAAGWTDGELSLANAPALIRITSGSAMGRTFLVSSDMANSETTLTIDAGNLGLTDLTALGIQAGPEGDTYELLRGETLETLFGVAIDNGILAGSDPTVSDHVQLLVGGAQRSYYLNSTTNPMQWRRVGPNTPSNTVVIMPETGVFFSRLANAELELTFRGTVPTRQRVVKVADGGSTLLSAGWAADTTLAELGLPDLASWTSGSSPSVADTVRILAGGANRSYYYDGTHWRRVGPNIVSDAVIVPKGSVYVVQQQGVGASSSLLTQLPPYTLTPPNP